MRYNILGLIWFAAMSFPAHVDASEKRLICVLEKTCIQGRGCFDGATPWPAEYILKYDGDVLISATATESICKSNSRVKIDERYITFSCNTVMEGEHLLLWSIIDRVTGAYEDGQQKLDDPAEKIFEQGNCSEQARKI